MLCPPASSVPRFAPLPHVFIPQTVSAVVCCSSTVAFMCAVCKAEDVGALLDNLFGFLFVPECDNDGGVSFACPVGLFGHVSWEDCQLAVVLVFNFSP